MLRLSDPNWSRREWLRVGGIGLGSLSLPQLYASTPSRPTGKAKAVIVLSLLGGPPQQESWDPKPDAPAELRGPFGTIATQTPGYRVCELMPATSKLTEKIAVMRAVTTGDNAHSSSGYQMLTGVPHVPMNVESVTAKAPNYWPSLGAIVRHLHRNPGKLPSAITVPEHIWNDGNFPWPGQDAGFLGQKFHPWLIHCDPASPNFRISDFALPDDVTNQRFGQRRTLLEQVNRHLDHQYPAASMEGFDNHTQKAVELLGSSSVSKAFDLSQEPRSVRDRYGSSRFAQSCLLARRLIEAGTVLVQVNWTRIANLPNQGGWDTHAKNAESLQGFLMPILDRAYTALIEDLDQRGMLDQTLVVWMGEFGRTPRINGNLGRDHWGNVFSIAMAGGGVKGGAIHGASDRIAGYPVDGRVEARDVQATIFHCLGHRPDTEMHDSLQRPLPISRGKVIDAIL